ncbi:MAG: putative Zn finger-like uncharacterized protein [Yoonia sp.]|jgi:predicted Zn finger-like uncharacterized protein
MRLICPNCDAEYNVADDAIPQGGRDVQCSSCNTTWFQTRKSRILSREVSRILSTPLPSVVKTQSRDETAYDAPQSKNGNAEGPQHEPVADRPRHRQIDPSVANILRKEAARNQGVTDYSASKPTLRRESTPEVVAETRKRIARIAEVEGGTPAGTSQAGANVAVPSTNPRAVPDINEINAALRGRAGANIEGGLTELEKHEAVRRQGFRRGFFFVLILIAVTITPYLLSEEITQNMPELSGYMATYIAVIDQLRVSLNALISGITQSISNLIG